MLALARALSSPDSADMAAAKITPITRPARPAGSVLRMYEGKM